MALIQSIQSIWKARSSEAEVQYQALLSSTRSDSWSESTSPIAKENDGFTEDEKLLESEEVAMASEDSIQVAERQPRTRLILLLHIGTIILYGFSGFFLWAIFHREALEQRCIRSLSPYSPLIEDGAIELYETNFENQADHQTVFRGPPNDDNEERWDKLWHYGAIKVPLERLADLNKTDNAETPFTRVPPDQGDGYAALVEGFHQMHCLNLIRQYTWLDEYDSLPDGWDPDSPVGNRMHVDHCIETLRLSLQCYADTTPFFIEGGGSETQEHGLRADFNVHHKCRNFDKIISWTKEHIAIP